MEVLGVLRNVGFGIRAVPGGVSAPTLSFDLVILGENPVPFSLQGSDLQEFLFNWNVSDIRAMEKLTVVVNVENDTGKQNRKISLVRPFLV